MDLRKEIQVALNNCQPNTNRVDKIEAIAQKYAELYHALQLQQTGVMHCSSKDIDKFYNDTMYTDQTNYYGVIQRTKKGDYVRWKQPSQMIKDFMRWKKNNA
jgi:hypothetical protein